MSRGLTAANQAATESEHVEAVMLAKIEFSGDFTSYMDDYAGSFFGDYFGSSSDDAPGTVRVHSGIGTITFAGEAYGGIGDLGVVSGVDESEANAPAPFQLSLSGIKDDYIQESLAAPNYGDRVDIWIGLRQDDGTLVDDTAKRMTVGYMEFATRNGDIISIQCQNRLSDLKKKSGRRHTDEDHQSRNPGDLGFQYIAKMAGLSLLWGSIDKSATNPYSGGSREPRNATDYR